MNPSAQRSPNTRNTVLELNRTSDCLSLSRQQIDHHLALRGHDPVLLDLLLQRPNLFAATCVMVADDDRLAMLSQISAIEAVTGLEGYQKAIADRNGDQYSLRNRMTSGLFMGYDFHLTPSGPRLIEVNTNAGGAFIVNELLSVAESMLEIPTDACIDNAADIERSIIAMIRSEWQQTGRGGQPHTLAIVDSRPSEQYLYPEMCLGVELFERHGIETRVVDVSDLKIHNNQLQADGWPIDMIYNRLTDFSLFGPDSQILRQARQRDLAVVSPAPSHHALFADKRNLSCLRDAARLRNWGASDAQIHTLAAIPASEALTALNAVELWGRRKELFFKPNAGFGARAAYRGSKLTHKTWESISSGGYIAQEFVAPAERRVSHAGGSELMKFDVRIYTYASRPLLSAARIYQGQTTNFRTPGGGFAPVVYLSGSGH